MTHHTKPVILLILANQITSMRHHAKGDGFLFLILPNNISPMAQHTKVVFFLAYSNYPNTKSGYFCFIHLRSQTTPVTHH